MKKFFITLTLILFSTILNIANCLYSAEKRVNLVLKNISEENITLTIIDAANSKKEFVLTQKQPIEVHPIICKTGLFSPTSCIKQLNGMITNGYPQETLFTRSGLNALFTSLNKGKNKEFIYFTVDTIGGIKNYYTRLGITSTTSLNEIKKAYRKLALELHPDKIRQKGGTEQEIQKATEKFKKIQEAYSVLSDSDTRKKYDIKYYSARKNIGLQLNLSSAEAMKD